MVLLFFYIKVHLQGTNAREGKIATFFMSSKTQTMNSEMLIGILMVEEVLEEEVADRLKGNGGVAQGNSKGKQYATHA